MKDARSEAEMDEELEKVENDIVRLEEEIVKKEKERVALLGEDNGR